MTQAKRKRAWKQHIKDWQASGLSGMAYCQQQSLTYARFVYWRKRLTEPVAALKQSVPSGFAKVAAVSVSDSESSESLTVSLPGGVSITGLHAGNVVLLVEQELGNSPFSGALSAFTNRQRNKINWLLDGYDITLLQGHKTLHYESVG